MADDKRQEAVCVTGANGFIGSWLVKTLLNSGYSSIHASIFPGSDTSHLLDFPGAKDHLVVYKADILDLDAVCKAVDGCKGVFHVASPCTLGAVHVGDVAKAPWLDNDQRRGNISGQGGGVILFGG